MRKFLAIILLPSFYCATATSFLRGMNMLAFDSWYLFEIFFINLPIDAIQDLNT
jgi:hypothetical protein